MGNYTNGTNEVKNSHNIYKNKTFTKDQHQVRTHRSQDDITSSNNSIRGSSGVSINTFKADSYNWFIGLTILLCIIFSLCSVGFAMREIYNVRNDMVRMEQDVNGKIDLLQKIIVNQ